MQEQERLRLEYARRVHEQRQPAPRTLTYEHEQSDSRDPTIVVSTRRKDKAQSQGRPVGTRPSGAHTKISPRREEPLRVERDDTYTDDNTVSYHTSRPTHSQSHRGPQTQSEGNYDTDDLTRPYRLRRLTEKSKFSPRIALATLPAKSKLPNTVGKYDGLSDLDDRI